jgi:molybdate transport system substrate-binding protein
MANANPFPDDWHARIRVWIERAGHAVLGKGRVELLEGIDRRQSISAAARAMGMSYRQAWLLVQSANKAAGQPLVVAATGGRRGGGAHLTPLGRAAVGAFKELQEQLRQSATTLLPHIAEGQAAASVHVAAAVSLEEVVGQLLADYAAQCPEVRVRAIFGASDELAEHVLAGAPVDLFIAAAAEPMDRLEAGGLVEPGTRTALASNTLVLIAPADRSLEVANANDLLDPGVGRIALAKPGCPLGAYSREYLEGLGFYDKLLARALQLDNSRSVVAAVQTGQADVGLAYGSDAARASGCRILFRVRQRPTPIHCTAALLRRGRRLEDARALLTFFASRSAARRFRQCGFLASPEHQVHSLGKK